MKSLRVTLNSDWHLRDFVFIECLLVAWEPSYMTEQERNAFPHLKWKLQYLYWDNNITFILLTKKALGNDWRIFCFFVYDFRKSGFEEPWENSLLKPVCVPNMVEIYFDCQNSKRMSARLCGNNLIIVAGNAITDSLQTSLVTQNVFKFLRKYFHCQRATNYVWVCLMLQFHVLALQRVVAGKRLRIS